ncbi:putative methyltransferase [gamma proteobacterium HdN1]|nr:putative methyltransferase [gamma proteobacterium HdN1]
MDATTPVNRPVNALPLEWQHALGIAEFSHALKASKLGAWHEPLMQALDAALTPGRHGDLPRWVSALQDLPELTLSTYALGNAIVTAGAAADCDDATRALLTAALQGLHPWRKGPFEIAGVKIDTEWRSDWKWQRISPHIAPLEGRTVLDVGCGSGYHLWRMLGEGARYVLGIDPSLLFYCQFHAIRRYLSGEPRTLNAGFLPIGIEHLPPKTGAFDTVFSMGVLYHRRSPLDHLLELQEQLRPGGQLVLETLVIDGDENTVLVPEGRYARMGNVWFIPTVSMLLRWMNKLGFHQPRMVDIGTTTTDEQRSTEWMRFQSLQDFLDPSDDTYTIEGYPAPKRAVLIAEAR